MNNFWKKATEEFCPGAHRQMGAHKHTLQLFKNIFLSRNLGQNMLKNALVFEKIWKNCRSVGSSAPKYPLASGGYGLRPQTPKLLLPLNLRVTFEHYSDFSASLKLRLII